MAVSILQTKVARGVSGDQTPTLAQALTGGSTVVVVLVVQSSSGFLFDGVTDANNTYTPRIQQQGGTSTNYDLHIYDKLNIVGGATSLTLDVAASFAGAYDYAIFELAGVDNGGTIATGFKDAVSNTSHEFFTTGLSGTGIIIGGGEYGDAITATITGWTVHDPVTPPNGVYVISRINTFSGEVIAHTISPASNASCVGAFYPEAAAAGGSLVFPRWGSVRR